MNKVKKKDFGLKLQNREFQYKYKFAVIGYLSVTDLPC